MQNVTGKQYRDILNNKIVFILSEEIGKFNLYLHSDKNINNYSTRTKYEIINDVIKFEKFLYLAYPNITSIAEISPSHIDNYKNFLNDSLGNSHRSINKILRAVRKFFNYLTLKYLIKINPALQVSYFKIDRDKPPKHIPQSQLVIILNILYQYKNGIRDVCITKLLASGFLLKEIFKLKTYNFNPDTQEIWINRGTTEVSNIYVFKISDKFLLDIHNYLELRKSFINKDNDTLFLSSTGEDYSMRTYQYNFRKALIQSDIKGNYTPRNVRASFCYAMGNNDIDKQQLQNILNQKKVTHFYNDDNPLKL